jgi:hypothetical protein
MLRDDFNLNGVQGTMHRVAPLMIVNDPYAQQIVLRGGYGCFGPGYRANASMGRAIRLVLLNLGGGLPGVASPGDGSPGAGVCFSRPWPREQKSPSTGAVVQGQTRGGGALTPGVRLLPLDVSGVRVRGLTGETREALGDMLCDAQYSARKSPISE